MPDNPTIWIVAIIATLIVVVIALWKGRFVEVGLNPPSLRFKSKAADAAGLAVGEGLALEDAKVGDVAGVKSETAGASVLPEGNVSVAKGARITRSTTGDIVGVKQAGSPKEKP